MWTDLAFESWVDATQPDREHTTKVHPEAEAPSLDTSVALSCSIASYTTAQQLPFQLTCSGINNRFQSTVRLPLTFLWHWQSLWASNRFLAHTDQPTLRYIISIGPVSTHYSLVDSQLNATMWLISGTHWPTPLAWLPVWASIEPPALQRNATAADWFICS